MPFLIALQFLSRFTVTLKRVPTSKEMGKSIVFFPLVGLVIGVSLYLIALLLPYIWPDRINNVILLFLWVFLTGGLHLDGFMDTMDGLGSGQEKEKMLEIMKDSRVGAFGSIGLVFILGMKFVLLQELLLSGDIIYLIIIPLLARYMIVLLMAKSTPAKKEGGLSNLFLKDMPANTALLATIISLVICLPFLNFKILLIVPALILWLLFLLRFVAQRFSGITGDILGFTAEASEVYILLILTLNYSYLF